MAPRGTHPFAVLLSADCAATVAHAAGASASKASCEGTATVPLPMRAPTRTRQALDFNVKTSAITLAQIASASIPPFHGLCCFHHADESTSRRVPGGVLTQ